jgi:site-specific DNA-methyltransferase (adenine-specific)/modification methylase
LEDIWEIKRGKKIDKSHSAVFPEELVDKIVTLFSNQGDLIYDPFMGTGTTAVSCIKNKRNWIGSEISSKYCGITKERIKKM